MENFIVSARKYRPITFDTVVGQAHITNTLKNAVKNNHLAQAFLFTGPRGVGKTTCARILAKTINCLNLSETIEACNECVSCKSFNESASFNVHELDAASNNSVEDIRNLVDQVRIPPQVGKYKIYIIDEVHMLSAAAFNAFLKTLEEPPSYAKFILATTEKHKIIPTILSRCQIFDFKRITVEDIAKHLAFVAKSEGITAEQEALHVIALKADGALRDALSLFDQIVSFAGSNITYKAVIENLNVLDYEYYFTLTDYLLQSKLSEILLLLNDILDKGFDGHHFIIGLGEHLRCLLISKDAATHKLLETTTALKDRYKEQASKCTPEFLLKALDLISKCDLQYKSSNSKRLLMELTLMQMSNSSIVTSTSTNHSEENKKKNELTSTNKSHTNPTVSNFTTKNQISKTTTVNIPVTPSIKIANSQEKDTNKTVDNFTIAEKYTQYTSESKKFTQDELNSAWNEFANNIAKDYPNLHATLTARMPNLIKENVIQFTIDNKIQEAELKAKNLELMTFLREKLQNNKITLQIDITQFEQSAKPFTTIEKFNKLHEINPNISLLKDKLDLEIDF